MDGEQLGAHRGHPDVELLKQLAAYRIEISFAQLEFAARELPKTAVPLVKWSSANEKTSVVLDDSSENSDS